MSQNDKLPAFQFYPGDWMKDPLLRSCSIFARGLLVDILCFCWESPTRGRLVFKNGEPWLVDDICNMISGGDREEIREGFRELIRKGVLSQDDNGVYYSRRMVRDEEIRESRRESGRIGGLATQAKRKQKGKQSPSKQASKTPASAQAKSRSSTSSSTSTSTSIKETPLPLLDDSQEETEEEEGKPAGKKEGKGKETSPPIPVELLSPKFTQAWGEWKEYRKEIKKPLTYSTAAKQLIQFRTWGIEKSVQAINDSIRNGWQGVFEPDRDKSKSSALDGLREFMENDSIV